MMRIAYLSAFLILFPSCQIFSQNQSEKQIIVESILGEYLTEFSEESEKSEVIDYLLDLTDNPINLNYCSRKDLRSLPFLTEYHINNFMYYRYKYGKLLSIYELQTIEGFDREFINMLLFFCSIDNKSFDLPNFKTPARHQLIIKSERALEEKQGFKSVNGETPKYRGDPNKFLIRYNFSKRDKFDFGITLEKDPGERLAFSKSSNHYLFDYTSFFLSVKNKGLFENIIIGDYRLQAGQGLVFGSAFSFGKSSDAIAIGKNYNSGIRAYQSSFEHKSFSGIGVSVSKGKLKSNIIVSQVDRDATLKFDNETKYIESLRKNGYHRTDSELRSRKVVKERSLGLNTEYQNSKETLLLGFNYLMTQFSIPFRRRSSPENIYDFYGKTNHISSIYMDYSFRKTHIFSELSGNLSGGKALLAGLTHHIYGSIFLSSLYRNYSENFHSFHGNSFSENSTINNEKGIYLGLKFSPFKHLTTEVYLDKYEHPWLKYGLGRPSKGNDALLKLNYSRYRIFDAYFILRTKIEDESLDIENQTFKSTSSFVKKLYILNLKIYPNNYWTFQQRIQLSNFKLSDSLTNGFLLSTSLNYQKNKVAFSLSFTTFDTDDYQNRQYIYLRSVPYSYSVPSFQNRGSNLNLFFKYRITKYISFYTSFNQSYFPYVKEIGSGNEKSLSNKKSTLRFAAILDL